MQLTITSLYEVSDGDRTIDMKHFTGEASRQVRRGGDPRADISHSLANYVSGTGDWDTCLSLWFDEVNPDVLRMLPECRGECERTDLIQ